MQPLDLISASLIETMPTPNRYQSEHPLPYLVISQHLSASDQVGGSVYPSSVLSPFPFLVCLPLIPHVWFRQADALSPVCCSCLPLSPTVGPSPAWEHLTLLKVLFHIYENGGTHNP